ncbi:hypothetical protein [Prescottella agglutinans]|uniref:Uncharacterized protein n=1 Tax=Prescottella agglutinans TaxID=1644129 RepID=A0ABT6ML52_9NOCA|nr:hypothetical protein [Prescottella agglutinans]MDH6284615.1 hypothetical protein [Prescottella agglutinans]
MNALTNAIDTFRTTVFELGLMPHLALLVVGLGALCVAANDAEWVPKTVTIQTAPSTVFTSTTLARRNDRMWPVLVSTLALFLAVSLTTITVFTA